MTELLDLGLELHPGAITHAELRDPGLYPDFTYFHANIISSWLRFIPGRSNILQSAWYVHRGNSTIPPLLDARMVFLDSGAITPLIAAVAGKGPAAAVFDWMDRQDAVLACAHNLAAHGVQRCVVAALDLPQYDALLTPAGISRPVAMELTLRNAEQFARAWYDGALPPGYIPCFCVQGVRVEEYLDCMEAFEDFGILGMVRDGEAWLAIGGARDASPPALLTICRAVRQRLGEGHIHALGIGRQSQLVPLARAGYISGSDSSATTTEVLFNRGVHAMRNKLPRPLFVTEALWAVSAIHYEATLAAALESARKGEVFEQEMLV